MSTTRTTAFSKHLSLLRSLVPELAPASAVVFGLVGFSRMHSAFRSLTASSNERAWLDRLAEVEEEWWAWCVDDSTPPRRISSEAQKFADAVELRKVPDPFRRTFYTTCVGMFTSFEEQDCAYSQYSVMRNFQPIELLEEDLPVGAVDELVLREIGWQKNKSSSS